VKGAENSGTQPCSQCLTSSHPPLSLQEKMTGPGNEVVRHFDVIKPIERLTVRLKRVNLMPNISVRKD